MAIFTNLGIKYLAEVALGKTVYYALACRLFTNAAAPDFDSVTYDFHECTLAGYSPVLLSPDLWTGHVISGQASYTYQTLSWTLDAYSGPPVTLWGYFITQAGSSVTFWAGRFGEPFVVPNGGETVNLSLGYCDGNTN